MSNSENNPIKRILNFENGKSKGGGGSCLQPRQLRSYVKHKQDKNNS